MVHTQLICECEYDTHVGIVEYLFGGTQLWTKEECIAWLAKHPEDRTKYITHSEAN